MKAWCPSDNWRKALVDVGGDAEKADSSMSPLWFYEKRFGIF